MEVMFWATVYSTLETLVSRLLPGPRGIGSAEATGYGSQTPVTESSIEAMGRTAARTLNQ